MIVADQAADGAFLEDTHTPGNQSCPFCVKIIIKPRNIPNEILQYYFSASDIVALPFKDFLNSGSLLLAMSLGRRVVAPMAGSIPEIACSDGYFGSSPDNGHGLTEALTIVMNCDSLAEKGCAVEVYAQEKYAWNEIAGKLKSFYEIILQK